MTYSSSRRQQPRIASVLVVLILALAVQGTAGQLWDKLPLLGRFSKAAQAAKAAAAAITVHASPPSGTPSLPPAPATPVVAAVIQAAPPAEQAAAAAASESKHGWGKKGKAGKKLGTTGKNDTQAGCSCLAEWEAKPGGPRLSGCANPDNDPLVSDISSSRGSSSNSSGSSSMSSRRSASSGWQECGSSGSN
jgi:hypothetical protein